MDTAEFSLVDELGYVHHPSVRPANGANVPTRLVAGRSVTLTLKAVLPVGGGRLGWAPQGSSPTVGWDFDVETA